MSVGADAGAWQPAPAALSVFESLARLYAPTRADIACLILEGGESWTLDPDGLSSAGVVVWGNAPSTARSPAQMVGWAVRRELALRRARSGVHRLSLRAVHRLPAPYRAGTTRHVLRQALLSGLIAELGIGGAKKGRHERVIDAVARAAGATPEVPARLRPSRDGSALARLRGRDGFPFELRVATVGGRKDPARNGDALEELERAAIGLVPRLHRRGITAGASWTSESLMRGAVPRRLSRRLMADVVHFCARLPRGEQATSLRERMLRLEARYPRFARLAAQLADAAGSHGPGVVQHGDLWAGNLLAADGRLTGVIDWDTWHPAGLPGVDLLQLVTMRRRQRSGEDIGDLWLSGCWRSPDFLSATAGYWRAIGVRPNGALLEAVGLDWWAGQVFKRQSFAAQPEWVERNIDRVLIALEGGGTTRTPASDGKHGA
jgi:hypothetical protein